MFGRLSHGMRAATFLALSAISGGENPVPAQAPQRIARTEKAVSDLECAASTVYVADPGATFDVSVVHASGSKSPVLSLRDGAGVHELQRIGGSDDGKKAFSSYRVEPPKGGWTPKDNGEHNIVCDDKIISRFTVNIKELPQGDYSTHVLSVSNAGSTTRVRLSIKGSAINNVDARGLMKTGFVLRATGKPDIPVQLQPSRSLDNDAEISIDATTPNVPAGTYDIVQLSDIPTTGKIIPKGTIATVRVP